jgi:hypothetical protein
MCRATLPDRVAIPCGLRYLSSVLVESMKTPDVMHVTLRSCVTTDSGAPTFSGEPLAARDLD